MALIDFQEGRRYAIDVIESARFLYSAEDGLDTVIRNLEQSLEGKPDSYAAGIESVLIAVRKAKK